MMTKIKQTNHANVQGMMRSASAKFQRGVTLIEVMVAMFILAFGALAIVNLQTASAVAIQSSADHFKINELGLMIASQLKIDSERAANGDYNTVYADDAAPGSAPTATKSKINAWKASMQRSTPNGETQINCDALECTISLRWSDTSEEDLEQQVFNLKTPI